MRRSIIATTVSKLDPGGWLPVSATRCTLALALVLLGGALLGHADWGVAASIGALNVGMASLTGVYRARLRLMLTLSLLVPLVTLLGILLGGSPALSVLAVLVICFVQSVYGEQGPQAARVGLPVAIIFVVMTGLPFPPAQAPVVALLVLVGALFQVLMLSVVWPVSPHRPERRSVALAYAELARYAAQLPGAPLFPAETPFQNARSALADAASVGWRPQHDRMAALYAEAEALRGPLVNLARLDAELRAARPEAAEPLRLPTRLLARMLEAVSGAVLRQRPPQPSSGVLRAFEEAAARLAQAVGTEAATPYLDGARLVVNRLAHLGELHPEETAERPEAAAPPSLGSVLRRPGVWQTALRYSLAVGVATAAYKFGHLAHGYWLPLTVGLVLRADYFTTVTRGLARFGGTLLGVLLALPVGLLHPGATVSSALLLLAGWLAFALLSVNYLLFSACITLYVVFSLAASGVSEAQAGELRLLFTLAGGLFSLIAFVLWPQWRSPGARALLRQAASQQVDYARSVLSLARGESVPELQATGAAARQSRVGAEAGVQAALTEPSWVLPAAERHRLSGQLDRLSRNAAALASARIQAQHGGGRGLAATAGDLLHTAEALADEAAPDARTETAP